MKIAKWKFPFGESLFAKLPNGSKFAKRKSPFGESLFAKLPNAEFIFRTRRTKLGPHRDHTGV